MRNEANYDQKIYVSILDAFGQEKADTSIWVISEEAELYFGQEMRILINIPGMDPRMPWSLKFYPRGTVQ